ncbi:MAG: hypothetical protein PHD37_06340 [Gallionellaceae bacterium]|nr:hypothetical protein [Gallionellaceae bacterium]
MDEETRNIELMKIAATLTLARCVLRAATVEVPPDIAKESTDAWFIEYRKWAEKRLDELMSANQVT